MEVGLLCFLTGYSISPAELAQAAEAAGFESVWMGDHSHVPLGPDSGPALDTRSGEPVPVHYAELLDPFVALSTAAAVTSRVKVGTGICLITQRDVITTAKAVASLDHLSGGRFLFGVGAGWNKQEMIDHGTDPRTRRTRLRESVEAMKAIWTNEVAEYKGSTVAFGPMRCGPEVRQRPHPPIFLGGNASNLDRVVEYADGWLPSTTVDSGRDFLRHIPELRRKARAAGRDQVAVTAIHVTEVEALVVGAGEFGDDDWSAFATAGVDRVVLIVPPGRDGALRQVERYARFTGR